MRWILKMKKQTPILFLLVLPLLAAFAAPSADPESFSLRWYLRHAKVDMRIGSYKPAIEAYEKALAIAPDNREAMRYLGLAYEFQGLLDKAVSAYDRYLDKYPDDPAIAFRQAEILSWSRYAYRRADALHYYELGLKYDKNPFWEAQYSKLLPVQTVARPNTDVIASFEKALAADPESREAMRSLGSAYENQGLFEKAVALYDSYLAKHPDDAEIAFRQAEILSWSRFSGRREDALRYYQMGLKAKSDPHERLNYARLLATNQETSRKAIEEYKRVLEKDPNNGEAHRGLALAYGWIGDNDRALYHSRLALKSQPENDQVKKLNEQLSQGREPKISGKAAYFNQHGGNFGLAGFSTSLEGTTDLNPFVTGSAEMGHVDYWHSPDRADDVFFSGGAEARFDTVHRFQGRMGHHSVGPESRSLDGEFSYAYVPSGRNSMFKAGFKRDLRTDSFLALAGEQLGGVSYGAARSNLFYGEFDLPMGDYKFWMKPYAGWVSAQSLASNKLWGTDLRVDSPRLAEWNHSSVSAAYKAEAAHYENDQSGLSPNISGPLPGGYFSPQVFVTQTPLLSFQIHPRPKHQVRLEGGPSVQYVKDNEVSGAFRLGTEAEGSYLVQLTRHFSAQLLSKFLQVSNVTSRFSIEGALTAQF